MPKSTQLNGRSRHVFRASWLPRERWETNMKKLLFAISLISAVNAVAQTAPGVVILGGVDLTASLRSRLYVWDWFQPIGAHDIQYAYSGNLLRLNFTIKRDTTDF